MEESTDTAPSEYRTLARMRAYVALPPFGIDALTAVERPIPTPGPGQVLVRMRAVALNYRDVMVVNGSGAWRAREPRVPASDGVGEVVMLGTGVTRVELGDRVAGIFLPRWIDGALTPEKLEVPLGGVAADGVLAEYVLFDAESVVRVPEHLSDVEAATLPCAAVTAWHAIAERHDVRPGETVLVQGTGGVSLFVLQFARLRGAEVIVTSSSDEKLARALALGARHGVNYRTTPAWDERVLELTAGRGVDHVVEVVGAENLNRSMNALRLGGTVSIVGLLAGTGGQVDTFRFASKNARLHGIEVGSRAMFEAMNAAIAAHGLRPVVDRVFGFDDARAALRYLEAGAHFGKVVLSVGEAAG
jgi:NADPH:quinone reductase-like Zn-dependent oxidoreductase